MKIISVYTVHTTIDEYGRHGELVGIYSSKKDADKAAEGVGWYSSSIEIRECL